MDNVLFTCVVFVIGVSSAAFLPNHKGDSKLDDDKVKRLDSKIAQLRDLVNEIKNANEKKDPTANSRGGSTAKESDMTSSGPSERTNTHLTSEFSPEEIAILKKLKAALEGETTQEDQGLKAFQEAAQNEKKPEHIGTFMNQPIPDQKEPEPEEPEKPDTGRLKELAALMPQRSHPAREDNTAVIVHKNTFRENLLNVLVDRLLEDTDALLRKGFSLDDVLENLSEKAAMERERTALEQTLEKLLNDRHV